MAVTPFSTLRSLRMFILAQTANSAGLGQLHWEGEDKSRCCFKGQSFEVDAIKRMAQHLVAHTEHLLFAKVLHGISLEALGWIEPNYTQIRDKPDESAYGYSLWRDPTNISLHAMHDSLLNAFMTHDHLDDYYWSQTLPNGNPDWRNDRRLEWLEDLGDFCLHLAACTHIYGGQPRRGPEVLSMRNHNVAARDRNLRLHGEILIFILGYSKTTALTQKDRMDVHALPPRITHMFFILNALVQPLAVQWVKELVDATHSLLESDNGDLADQENLDNQSDDFEDEDMSVDSRNNNTDAGSETIDIGDDIDSEATFEDEEYTDDNEDIGYKELGSHDGNEAIDTGHSEEKPLTIQISGMKPSDIQATFTFASVGQRFNTAALSNVLRKFTQESLGVCLGLSEWRHVCIAVQRDHLGLVDDPKDGDTFFDLQASHSGRVSKAYYAVTDLDRNLMGADSILKYIQASQCLHAWLNNEPIPHEPR
jgi:hypothetical protein